jgi:hypothetical protein
MSLFEQLKTDLMEKFGEKDRGTSQKFDTIAFYGDFREILIVDEDEKKMKRNIKLLVNNFENVCDLTDKQRSIIEAIINM